MLAETEMRAPFLRSAMELVDAAASSNPDAIALRASGTRMTYRAMMAAVDRLAGEMAGAGIGPDEPVGICLERSFQYVIAMLAAARAGGAFLPLDPAWPQERLLFALDDARAPVVVTSSERRHLLAGANRTVILVDGTCPAQASRIRPLRTRAHARDLAYVIYTSGSTGEPKGAEITQGNLLSLICWHRQAFGVTRRDRASFVASLGFDAAIWEIWPYLSAGACVVIPDESVRKSSDALQRWLIDEKVTLAFVPTPLAESMIAAQWPPDTALRFLLTGGDRLHASPVNGLPFAVVNNYGPTECTVVATSGVVPPSNRTANAPTIGRPIAGTRIHILDEHRAPVRPHQVGEIYIGGAGVGRGYRRHPELTAERFVTDPFAPDTDCGARLYRTGDLARFLADGQIEFHGRCDHQIKIRGHRVELDEILASIGSPSSGRP